MSYVNPDLSWYTSKSKELGATPRCPFASVHKCPRYFLSLSLLGMAGSTSIAPETDQELLERWRRSDLWPVTAEQEPSIMERKGAQQNFHNFCPEVLFDRFGLFASGLHDYADEIDRGLAHSRLGKEAARVKDWRWVWASVLPMHYFECPVYSPLLHDSSSETLRPKARAEFSKSTPGDLEPKPPELLANLKWILLYGKRHWKLMLLAALVLLLGFIVTNLRSVLPVSHQSERNRPVGDEGMLNPPVIVRSNPPTPKGQAPGPLQPTHLEAHRGLRIVQRSEGSNSPNTAVVGNNNQVTINPEPAERNWVLSEHACQKLLNELGNTEGKVSIGAFIANNDGFHVVDVLVSCISKAPRWTVSRAVLPVNANGVLILAAPHDESELALERGLKAVGLKTGAVVDQKYAGELTVVVGMNPIVLVPNESN